MMMVLFTIEAQIVMFGLEYYEGANPGKRKRELVKIDDEKNQKNQKNK